MYWPDLGLFGHGVEDRITDHCGDTGHDRVMGDDGDVEAGDDRGGQMDRVE